MKTKNTNKLYILLSLGVLLTSSCSIGNNSSSNEILKNAPKFIYNKLVDFTGDVSHVYWASDKYSNGSPFGVIWKEDNVKIDAANEIMSLSITKEGDKYYGSEIRTHSDEGTIRYGYFSTKMKASNVSGTTTTFFTYTGPTENNPHDEIDIEILGRDTTKVQFNYFVNNIGSHEYMYDLGFDASEDFHTYGFYWDESKIIWYIDDIPVYSVTGKMPYAKQRVFANFWAGDPYNLAIINWMNKLDDKDLPANALYKDMCASYLDGTRMNVATKSKAL